jgi:iron transport multicopper oxidase
MIVNDPNDPYAGQYDEEVVLTVSDWYGRHVWCYITPKGTLTGSRYHNQSLELVRNMLVTTNTQFIPPLPDSIIMNEGANAHINFVEGKTYRIRMISFAAFASAMVHFESHTMQVIMNDASYINEAQAYQLRIAPAQRYDFLISAISRDHGNYPFLVSLDVNRDFSNPSGLAWPHNYTGYLVMDSTQPTTSTDVVAQWQPADDSHFTSLNGSAPYGPVSTTIKLDFQFCRDANNLPR